MKPVCVYFRASQDQEDELTACENHLDTVRYRTSITTGSLVIPRYSMLPFPEELEMDVDAMDAELINSSAEHHYVADLMAYVKDLEGLTPRTWDNWTDLPDGCSFIMKGRTNSRKHEWNTRMFCKTKADIPRVASSLMDDDLIKSQGLIIREYVELVKLGEGINGLPISNEWRFFVLDGRILDAGFYWASEPDLEPKGGPPLSAYAIVADVIQRVGAKIRFYVVDVGEKVGGWWTVIELNDGCMSGLSMIYPDRFYKRLRNALS